MGSEEKLVGWAAICKATGLSRFVLKKYGFPIRQWGRGSHVYAYSDDLKKHRDGLEQHVVLPTVRDSHIKPTSFI